MKEQKYHIYLTNQERSEIIESLIDFKNLRMQQGKYTDAVDEVLVIKDKFNEKLGVSKAQEQAMLAGSMIRWDSIAAKPKSYDENGKAIKPKDYER